MINLQLLKELAQEAKIGKSFCNSYCYNSESRKKHVDDALFVMLIKTNVQANILYNHLKTLHQICHDFAASEFQKYIDEHNQYADDETLPFDPFENLIGHFDSGSIDDLPPRIEQYTELCTLAANFTQLRSKRREGFDRFLGRLIPKYYQVADEQGEMVMIPEVDMPAEVINTMEVNREIQGVETEYALDGYNQFYETARGLIESYRLQGDVQTCALKILQLYKPS